MAKFHTLTVTDIVKETQDCVSVAFQIPEPLKEEFNYIQGQYVTLKMNIGGEEVRRSYSICSSPVVDEELRIAIKKVAEGRVSGFINENLKVGDTLDVMTPMGNFFTQMDPSHKKNYVLFAGGSGITPMLSILKTILHKEPLSSAILFYGNQDEESIIFKKHLESLQEKYKDRFRLYNILDKPSEGTPDLFKGMMVPDKIKALVSQFVDLKADNEYFICGPGPMMTGTEQTLQALQVPKPRIHLEYFTASPEQSKKSGSPDLPLVESQVTVILDGDETTLSVNSNGPAILDAALDAGLDVPFACKGAVCCTCRAKLLKGEVKMDMNYALSDEEVAKGYILTCQSHPLTPEVTVDYDV